ncbi:MULTISPECIES: Mu transposase domain-containing protein [Sorangium]|uniref:Mu transposase domain-containing protein n=1 Tax=Sorangium sp. So ce836 TaxID=2969250 RepID=UPI00101A0AC1|nr:MULTISPECIES: hypothetical protein [Sorangium]WCQ96379.1 hypothetical protein NQZ70_09165 [Sorangium sp. Soce836]
MPWRLVEREVWLRATPSSIVVYADDEAVARHERRGAGLRSTLERHLPEGRAALRHRSRAYWEQRADQMSQDVGRFVREVFDAADVLSQLRKVQAIVTPLEKFPQERAQAACRRASHYGNLSYQGVRDILRRGLDFEQSPQSAAPAAWADAPPRFARDLRLQAASRLSSTGGDHGPH